MLPTTGASPVQVTGDAASFTPIQPIKAPSVRVSTATQTVETPIAKAATQPVEAPGARPVVHPITYQVTGAIVSEEMQPSGPLD